MALNSSKDLSAAASAQVRGFLENYSKALDGSGASTTTGLRGQHLTAELHSRLAGNHSGSHDPLFGTHAPQAGSWTADYQGSGAGHAVVRAAGAGTASGSALTVWCQLRLADGLISAWRTEAGA